MVVKVRGQGSRVIPSVSDRSVDRHEVVVIVWGSASVCCVRAVVRSFFFYIKDKDIKKKVFKKFQRKVVRLFFFPLMDLWEQDFDPDQNPTLTTSRTKISY